MLETFPPLFSRIEQLELRGDTLERWGNVRLANQSTENEEQAAAARAAGLRHLRAAGLAFEQLAELRFDSRFYTSDLWHSADDYYRGNSFSRAVPVLKKYLDYEPELRNAEALLRLGQAQLALGQVPQSIAAFEECIEFHPIDSHTYQARIDCAKAHWKNGDTDRAEELLRDNIAGSLLTPESKEWKDSYFQLGILLHEVGRHEEAIDVLEQAMQRYEHDPQRLMAQYVVGESYRLWAKDFADKISQARTASEREKSLAAATERMNTALAHFEDVQRAITLKTHDIHSEPLLGAMLRNCYMLEGTVLFDLGKYDPAKYKEAIEAYSNVASLYPDEPFVLETFVQIANCWRRLSENEKARGSIRQAQIVLNRLPADADFASATALNREEWRMMLADMSTW
jgi:tetratricopeptide (TPR) repeat protein